MNQRQDELRVSTFGIARLLAVVAAALVFLDLSALAFELLTGHSRVFGLLPMIDLDRERNLGTMFSVAILCADGVLFALVAASLGRGARGWKVWSLLSLIFFFLAFDEYAEVHERLIGPVRHLFDTSGVFYFAWIIPYGILVGVLCVVTAPTLVRLPPHPRKWLFLSGASYLTGALGFEALGGWRYEMIGGERGRPDLPFELLTTAEESRIGSSKGLSRLEARWDGARGDEAEQGRRGCGWRRGARVRRELRVW